ncbi:hypothetical protein HFZ78_20055 [Priestia megaterium]|uniref:Uncharacterized protein n=1 Tax=Priestia megaterium TaxID=1404 RepID=A0A6H1P607_PRIMG|nr:hypothetical protein [Priestia megaterium]QIZ08711.1 hypothetical protein HFZ78_20055 [Priestia megaterium]
MVNNKVVLWATFFIYLALTCSVSGTTKKAAAAAIPYSTQAPVSLSELLHNLHERKIKTE